MLASDDREGGNPQTTHAERRAARPARDRRPVAALDRYLLLDELGRGGMGVVYSAYDPDLDRRVALKVLNPGSARAHAKASQDRLLREAQAMARLSHPNVVQVFDVGVFEEQVFVAMELVEGRTLDGWMRETPRPGRGREAVRLLLAAGQGLAAAHAAGLVHRDFKPSNVLVGEDGRVRVADFGIARSHGEPGERAAAGETGWETGDGVATVPALAGDPLATPLTAQGAILGTPGYMAPEVLRGQPADARSDQFAFCVTLYEALFGVAPFAGGTPSEIARSTLAGALREPPDAAAAPAWLAGLVRRGLAADPADRFPSMRELLAELGRDRGARWRRLAGVGLALVALTAVTVAVSQTRQSRSRLCREAGRELTGVWDEERRAAVAQAFAGTGRPFAAASLAGAQRALDAWSSAWAAMRQDACAATHLRGEQSAALLDLRMRCLDHRLDDLRALTDLLVAADAATVERAVQASHQLASLEPCADAATLTASLPPPATAEARRQVAELGRELARARALWMTAKLPAAAAAVGPVVARATELDDPPTLAEALRQRALIEEAAGEFAAAEATLFETLAAAQRGHHDLVVAQAWTDLTWVAGYRLRRFAEGERWGRLAAAAIARVGRAELRRELGAELTSHLAMIASARGGDRERELALQLSALAEARAVHPPGDPALSRMLNRVGIAYLDAGRSDEALRYFQLALAESESALGREHPTVAIRMGNIAMVLEDLGRLDEALAEHHRALAIELATIGGDHPQVAATHGNIALLLDRLGRSEEALPEARRALAIVERTAGTGSAEYGAGLVNLGTVERSLGRTAAALRAAERAHALLTATSGPAHGWTVEAAALLGRLNVDAGRHAAAVPLLSAAIAARTGEPAADPTAIAKDRFALAQALWASGGDRAAARREAALAYAAFGAAGPEHAVHRAAVERWLAAHREG